MALYYHNRETRTGLTRGCSVVSWIHGYVVPWLRGSVLWWIHGSMVLRCGGVAFVKPDIRAAHATKELVSLRPCNAIIQFTLLLWCSLFHMDAKGHCHGTIVLLHFNIRLLYS